MKRSVPLVVFLFASRIPAGAALDVEALKADMTFFGDATCTELKQGAQAKDLKRFKSDLLKKVAADILKTALSPAWNDVLLLAALIGMRTVLNYLLEIELRNLGAQQDAVEQECQGFAQQAQ